SSYLTIISPLLSDHLRGNREIIKILLEAGATVNRGCASVTSRTFCLASTSHVSPLGLHFSCMLFVSSLLLSKLIIHFLLILPTALSLSLSIPLSLSLSLSLFHSISLSLSLSFSPPSPLLSPPATTTELRPSTSSCRAATPRRTWACCSTRAP